ncbi:LOW QUALITY PROTEIN: 17-beta-hydroxysteroid dehydrogenase type 3 [Acridotheres tristis]
MDKTKFLMQQNPEKGSDYESANVKTVTEQATDQNVKVIQANFPKSSVENIEKDMKDLDTGVLVNNVGMLHNPLPCCFLNSQKGLILDLSSGSTFPCPLYTMYSTSKTFIRFLQPLQAEYKAKVIIIQVVIPYGVSAPMTMYQNPNITTKIAEEFVSESLECVPFGDELFGCFTHETSD